MVAGDIVNTASRVQSVAEPGTVFVGDSTHRATEQTIVYAEAGSFELKGKEGLTPLWVARRVVSGLRGSLKSHGLEAPFVGRDRELRQIKDLFHTSADERKAHLLSITGIAGIGKSRLAWEFYKYFDEHLLDWSRSHPLFVVTLARPELQERRPTWGAGQRNFTSMYLEPLSETAMEELLRGLVPGLPDELRNRILARAEGVPLYAV